MSRNSKVNPHEHFIHPLQFILKEGNKIQNDYLDYSLLMLHIAQTEIFKSPKSYPSKSKTK